MKLFRSEPDHEDGTNHTYAAVGVTHETITKGQSWDVGEYTVVLLKCSVCKKLDTKRFRGSWTKQDFVGVNFDD
jgi:hypothetical protein